MPLEVPNRFRRIDSIRDCPKVDAVALSTAHSQILDIDWTDLMEITDVIWFMTEEGPWTK